MGQKPNKQTFDGKNIKVFVRVRPFNEKEIDKRNCVEEITERSISIKERQSRQQHTFTFDQVFNQQTTQQEVYEEIGQKLISSAFDGINGTIFCYGQTSSGKTHTCIGPNFEHPKDCGLLPRLIKETLNKIKQLPSNIEAKMKISMVEIYNEKIRDLLNSKKNDLKIRSNKNSGTYAHGATERYILNEKQGFEYLRLGLQNRAVSYTSMNARSSRSHMLFIINLYSYDVYSGTAKTSKITLIDLAGSEKLSRIGVQGKVLEQTKKINTSLTALGKVINMLSEGKSSHIPYRDSKLTRLLQESLGGNSLTNLIINVSPSIINDNQTLNSIRFGCRAKKIQNAPTVNRSYTVSQLLTLLEKAEQKIKQLNRIIIESNQKKRRSGRYGTIQLPSQITMHIIKDNDDDQSEFMFSQTEMMDNTSKIDLKQSLRCIDEDEREEKFCKTAESWKERVKKKVMRQKNSLKAQYEILDGQKLVDFENYQSKFKRQSMYSLNYNPFRADKQNISPRNCSIVKSPPKESLSKIEKQCRENLAKIRNNFQKIKKKCGHLRGNTKKLSWKENNRSDEMGQRAIGTIS